MPVGLHGMSSAEDITRLLAAARDGDPKALGRLLPLLYAELRALAEGYMRQERPDHTLQPTALVHEAYLRLVDQKSVRWQDRGHFFAVAAQAMRRILVDHARGHHRQKRGGGRDRVNLDAASRRTSGLSPGRDIDIVALDEALTKLADKDRLKADLVSLRYFAGLTVEQAAEILGISRATADRYWAYARAWLYHEISKGDEAKGR